MRYGYFDHAADEYVIDRVDVPASWINYLGTKDWCTVINQNAGGYSFYRSSQAGRVTRFRPNGVPLDRPGHYVYLRDDEDGDYWSCSWQPVGKPLAPVPDEPPATPPTGPFSAAADANGAGTTPPSESGDAGTTRPAHTTSDAAPQATFPLVSPADRGATRSQAAYRTRHGLSYSIFESAYRGIVASQRIFVPLDDDVELWDVTVRNASDRPRTLSLYGYVEFSFHSVQIDQENFQMSLYASGADEADGVIEDDFYYEPWTYHYFTATRQPDGFDTTRDAFIGAYRSETNPLAVERGACSSSQCTTQNHCGALQHKLTLAPGETVRLAYLLGYGRRTAGAALRDKYAATATVDQAFAALRDYWTAKKAVLACQTPSEAMNTLLNTWTLFQAETCVVWSRFASFVEVGGRVGLGYRDTAQDAMSVAHTNPAKVRQRLLELLHGQTAAGYGLHLFDPLMFDECQRPDIPVGVKLPTVVPGSARQMLHGLADACSDDHLWLVPTVVDYLYETGDFGLLRQVVPFADSGLTDAERADAMGDEIAGRFDATPATVYEHLRRAIEFTAWQVADNGIAKGLRADWNDCLNLGGGQTALVTFLHVWATKALAGLVHELGPSEVPDAARDLARFDEIVQQVSMAANRELWDGAWYARGFTSEGVTIGSASSPEGKIFLEHMPWAVIAGVASRERAVSSMDAVHEHLASRFGTHLTWPSYTHVDDTIGYVTRVYPGVKENGAIFSHPNAWPIIAEAMLGRGDLAFSYYEALAPSRQNDQIEVRRAEPYVYAQFVYGRDHAFFGRAENPWLTGSAGWMYTAATQHILGVRPGFDALTVDPCVPAAWDGFHVTRQWRGGTYDIEVRNPMNVCAGVAAVTIDGIPAEPVPDAQTGRLVAKLPVLGAGRPGSPRTHHATVVVTLG